MSGLRYLSRYVSIVSTYHWHINRLSNTDLDRWIELYLRSAQAANRGTRRKRNSADLATIGESVVRVFLRRLTCTDTIGFQLVR
jgi:hypothetical protein